MPAAPPRRALCNVSQDCLARGMGLLAVRCKRERIDEPTGNTRGSKGAAVLVERTRRRYLLIGGYALAAHGYQRANLRDVEQV